jgi:uncharacterized protein (DUF983 family)
VDGPVQPARRAQLDGVHVTVSGLPRAPVRRPRLATRSVSAYLALVAAILLAGLALAAVWAVIAPPAQVAYPVANPPQFLPESDFHRFDDLATFLVISVVVGLLIGAALWLWRSRRGPAVLLVGVLAALLGGLVAVSAGPAFAASFYPAPTHPAAGSIVTLAPVLEFAARAGSVRLAQWLGVLVVQPFGVALAYLVLAVWNGTPDLGRVCHRETPS